MLTASIPSSTGSAWGGPMVMTAVHEACQVMMEELGPGIILLGGLKEVTAESEQMVFQNCMGARSMGPVNLFCAPLTTPWISCHKGLFSVILQGVTGHWGTSLTSVLGGWARCTIAAHSGTALSQRPWIRWSSPLMHPPWIWTC